MNLCTHCHNRTPDPTPTNSRGPHGAQGPVLFGTAGYFPPGTVYDTTAILATHGSEKNPRLCAGCHVNALTGVDAGGNPVSYSGHSFHPLPCFMPGSPGVVDTTFTTRAPMTNPADRGPPARRRGAIAEPVAVQLLNSFRDEKEGYLDVLWVDLNGDETLDAYPADTGYLAKITAQRAGRAQSSTR